MGESLTINHVTEDPSNSEIVLYLIEDGPWPDDGAAWTEVIGRIKRRILVAADLVIDGMFAEKFPDSVGKKFRIQVDCPSGTPPEIQELVTSVSDIFANHQVYADAIRQSQFVSALRAVTGAELGRFKIPLQ